MKRGAFKKHADLNAAKLSEWKTQIYGKYGHIKRNNHNFIYFMFRGGALCWLRHWIPAAATRLHVTGLF